MAIGPTETTTTAASIIRGSGEAPARVPGGTDAGVSPTYESDMTFTEAMHAYLRWAPPGAPVPSEHTSELRQAVRMWVLRGPHGGRLARVDIRDGHVIEASR